MMKLRTALLSLTLALTVISLGAALLTPPHLRYGATAMAAEELQEPIYELRVLDGEICVYEGTELILHTGVAVSSLPESDRSLLDGGIGASSPAELTRLLEDLTS